MASRAPSASTRSGSTLGSRRGRHRRGRAPAGRPGVDGRARRHRDGDARRQPANGVGRGAVPPDGGAAPGEDPPHGDRGGATRPRRQGVDHLPARRIVGKLASDRRARSTRQATGAPIAREEVRGGPAQKRRRHGRRQTRIPAAGLNGAAPTLCGLEARRWRCRRHRRHRHGARVRRRPVNGSSNRSWTFRCCGTPSNVLEAVVVCLGIPPDGPPATPRRPVHGVIHTSLVDRAAAGQEGLA